MQATTRLKSRVSGTYFGWWMVVIGAIVSGIGSVQSASQAVFFLPLERELGLTRGQLSLVFSLTRLEGSIESPVVGWMIDKFGPRLPIVIGAVLGGVGFLILPVASTFWPFFIIYMGMISIGFQMGFISSMHAVANLWFIRYRTRAMSFFSSSLRLGNALFAPVLGLIVAGYSWRYGSVFSAVVVLAIALPLAVLIRRSPESKGLLPDGDKPGETGKDRKEEAPAKTGRGTADHRRFYSQGVAEEYVILAHHPQHLGALHHHRRGASALGAHVCLEGVQRGDWGGVHWIPSAGGLAADSAQRRTWRPLQQETCLNVGAHFATVSDVCPRELAEPVVVVPLLRAVLLRRRGLADQLFDNRRVFRAASVRHVEGVSHHVHDRGHIQSGLRRLGLRPLQ